MRLSNRTQFSLFQEAVLWLQYFLTEAFKDSLWLTRFFFSAPETTDPPLDGATVCLGPECSEEHSP